ncbi:MAG TPA: metallophosphoesterase [Trebonia sp.]
MADIRYVIVSDLHFGAENSVLTALTERPPGSSATGFAVDPQRPSAVLAGFVNGLRELTRGQDRPPTLILAGDILDLALSPDETAAMVFRLFAHLAFADGPPVFDPVVHYVPGNHDHHEWEIARESQYVSYACAQPPQAALTAPWHTTRLAPGDERPVASSALLTGLTRKQAGAGSGIEVRISYPNLALRTPGGGRSLIVSHGHFTESIYTLMSRLRDILYPGQGAGVPTDIERLEEENFAWVDFFWSTLGRSGQVGTDVGLIYADLTSPQDIDAFVHNLVSALLAKGKGSSWLHPAESWVLNAIFQREANRIARSERGTPSVTLSAAGQAGLRQYLEGPVRNQLRQEWGDVPDEVAFVYGHTHKPFNDRWTVNGFNPASGVTIANTGGWVVDTVAPAPVQGGVAVLVNDNLETASLQFYRQGTGPVPVQFLPPAGGGQPGGWQAELESRIDPAAEPWATLSRDAAEQTAQRHRLQAATVALRDMTSRTQTPPPSVGPVNVTGPA